MRTFGVSPPHLNCELFLGASQHGLLFQPRLVTVVAGVGRPPVIVDNVSPSRAAFFSNVYEWQGPTLACSNAEMLNCCTEVEMVYVEDRDKPDQRGCASRGRERITVHKVVAGASWAGVAQSSKHIRVTLEVLKTQYLSPLNQNLSGRIPGARICKAVRMTSLRSQRERER